MFCNRRVIITIASCLAQMNRAAQLSAKHLCQVGWSRKTRPSPEVQHLLNLTWLDLTRLHSTINYCVTSQLFCSMSALVSTVNSWTIRNITRPCLDKEEQHWHGCTHWLCTKLNIRLKQELRGTGGYSRGPTPKMFDKLGYIQTFTLSSLEM